MTLPIILCIECSTDTCSVAIGRGEQVIYKALEQRLNMHSKILALMIKEAMKVLDGDFSTLDAIGLSSGPGSYTGIRVGASTAKGLCYALNIPLVSMDTLRIIAAPHIKSLCKGDFCIPMIDARRREAYVSIFGYEFEMVMPMKPHLIETDSFCDLKDVDNTIIVCGNSAEKFQDLTQNDQFQYAYTSPKAEYMIPLILKKYIKKEFEDIHKFSPHYLKPPNITQSKKTVF